MAGWARRHPVATFFSLAFGLTWLVWVPRAATDQGLLTADWAVTAGSGWTHGPALEDDVMHAFFIATRS